MNKVRILDFKLMADQFQEQLYQNFKIKSSKNLQYISQTKNWGTPRIETFDFR